jgi:hypothetical protein
MVAGVFFLPSLWGWGQEDRAKLGRMGGQGNPLKTLHLLSKVSTDFPLTMHAA